MKPRPPKLPTVAMLAYRMGIRRALVAQQAKLWADIVASYKPPRADAAAFRVWWTFSRADAAADGGTGAPLALPTGLLEKVGAGAAKTADANIAALGIKTSRPMTPAEIRERVRRAKPADRKALAAKLKGAQRLVGISRGDPARLASWRKENVSLIKTLAADQKTQLREVLDEATQKGWHVKQLRTAIEERFQVARSRADLIARDQTLKLNAQLTRERQTSVGIEEYVWSTSSDVRVREEHAELDGQRFRWDDPPDMGNGDRAHPGEYFQCRCVALAVLPWLEES